MSLAIDVDRVEQVLLADGWHQVEGKSFALDAYEFIHDGREVFAGGRPSLTPSTGATWRESDGSVLACPVTMVLAVKWAGAKTDRHAQ
jgi:hypothetical protein